MNETSPPDNSSLLKAGDRKFLKVLAAPDSPPEDALNNAEKKVLKAFRDGQREIIVHPNGVSITAGSTEWPTAGDWQGQDALLHASFLRSLFLGKYGKFDPQLVTISCAWIEGMLNLSYCESRFPLSFFWCIFSKGISLRTATISELKLSRCLIGQDQHDSSLSATQVQVTTNIFLNEEFIAYGKVNLNGASIGGQLVCAGSYFEKGLTTQNLKAGASVLLSKGFNSNGEVNLIGADIGGQLSCTGGRFGKGLVAQNLKTGTSVMLREGFNSNGEVNLNGANIGGQLSCTGGHFVKRLIAQNLKTGGDVFLKGEFKSNDVVDLHGADIGGQFTCDGGHFEKGLIAYNLKTVKDVFLRKGFKSNDEVNLTGADIGGQLSCIGGHFEKGLTAHNLKAGSSVFLMGGFESNGEVDLSGADIGGQLDCGGHFEKGLTAQNLKTGKDVFLRTGFKPDGEVDLRVADIGGVLDCTGTRFENGLSASGLRYQWIELGGDWEKGLAWLNEMPESGEGFSPQPYEQLMMAYRRMGKPDWAREIGFVLEEKRHKHLPKTWRFWVWRAWHSILKWTIGYGYKPFRSLGWAIGLPLFGALLFSDGTQNLSSKFTSSGCTPAFLANEWIPSEGEAHEYWRQKGQAPQGYPKFQPFVYSLEATFPVLPFGQLDKWHSDNTLFRVVRWVWTFTGSLLLAILALFGVGTLGPNRKSESDGS